MLFQVADITALWLKLPQCGPRLFKVVELHQESLYIQDQGRGERGCVMQRIRHQKTATQRHGISSYAKSHYESLLTVRLHFPQGVQLSRFPERTCLLEVLCISRKR